MFSICIGDIPSTFNKSRTIDNLRQMNFIIPLIPLFFLTRVNGNINNKCKDKLALEENPESLRRRK